MNKITSIFRWLAGQFSLARLFMLIIFLGLVAAVWMSIASQMIDEDYKLQLRNWQDFKPQVPKGYGE